MTINKQQTYLYKGPEAYHSLVGQVMASCGYVGGHEIQSVGASVVLEEQDGRLHLACTYQQEQTSWQSEAWIFRQGRRRDDIKECLLQWHQRFCGMPDSLWGTLIGVRPTKLIHRLLDQGMTPDSAKDYVCRTYHTQEETAQDLVDMAVIQRPYVMNPSRTISLYVGIPYCPSHCMYCSFPSKLIFQEDAAFLQRFAEAVERDLADIAKLCRQYGLQVHSVYVGGGTPTCLPLPLLQRIIAAIQCQIPQGIEWTVEAGRPDTATQEILAMLRQYGVNRISVNPQTMQQHLLDTIGRQHTVDAVYQMYDRCRQMAFPIVNMDFIAGLPQQTVEDMRENMEIVCQLHPENVTIHTLALKKRAPLFHHPLRDDIPDAASVRAMLALCRHMLQQASYIPYYMYRQQYMAASFANVGYALPGTISAYNIEMMEERQTVLAAGPGSATKFVCRDGHSLEKLYMPKDVERYVEGLSEKIKQRRQLCAMIYGGEDL